ncbi:hypothetical protein [Helicobacter cetorum]|uniref:hypothetical protein n=1 Tax=Helicobacter cetorum TaxID=138563 RepID=UPI000CF0ECD0|nr:hypothetical protein [Helicobacter cetorum]
MFSEQHLNFLKKDIFIADRLVVLKGPHIFLLKNIEEIHEFLDGFNENDLIFEKVFYRHSH